MLCCLSHFTCRFYNYIDCAVLLLCNALDEKCLAACVLSKEKEFHHVWEIP